MNATMCISPLTVSLYLLERDLHHFVRMLHPLGMEEKLTIGSQVYTYVIHTFSPALAWSLYTQRCFYDYIWRNTVYLSRFTTCLVDRESFHDVGIIDACFYP